MRWTFSRTIWLTPFELKKLQTNANEVKQGQNPPREVETNTKNNRLVQTPPPPTPPQSEKSWYPPLSIISIRNRTITLFVNIVYYGKTHSSPLHLGLLPAEELCNSHKIHQTSHKVIEKIYRSMTNESLNYELNWPFQPIGALLLQMTQNHANCESKGLFTSSESGSKSEKDQRTSKNIKD